MRPEIEGASIVLLGSFNPVIFQPAWFAAQGLIRDQESQDAKIELIHEAFVKFSMEWLTIEVHQQRFLSSTHQKPYYNILRDLVVGAFKILTHTPIHSLGINFDFHFPMESEDTWHAVGHRVAPKEPWKGILEKPGLRSLAMEGARPDEYKGVITVRVEPSRRIKHGVYIHINDHYEAKAKEAPLGCGEIIQILESAWDSSKTRAEEIASKLMEVK
jgi:hypothetical protein